VLEERLRLMRIEKYGAGGEKLSHAQLELFEFEPVPCELIMEAESRPEPLHRSTKKSGKHPGRQELSANLPRVERVLPCTPDQRVCKRCGKEMVVIGYEESSRLDVEPAKYFVLVTKREKRACRSCEEVGVVSAPLPPQSGRVADSDGPRLRRFSRSWKAAVGCKSRCAITFPRFCPDLAISRSDAFQTLLPLRGLPGTHRVKRPGC
jgi:hypothetical protein